MARRKDKRRVSKDQLAMNVRKHFNGAAVNEIDVVVELVYKSRNKGTFMVAYKCTIDIVLTACRQGISHALSTRHHQEVMIDLPCPSTNNTTRHS
jgi:transcription elongation factor Elf1